MKKKFLIAATLIVSSLVFSANKSSAYTVLGSATLTPVGSSGHSYNLGCGPSGGTCYTNNGGNIDIYYNGGHIYCSMPVPPVLVPGPGGNYYQMGEVIVEVQQ